jgi:glycosyltransferase involved in cell wall biosynthesis
MKVIYDISVLGIGNFEKESRTGVYRAVESLAYKLKESKDVELMFSACQSYRFFIQSLDYLKNHPEFKTIPMVEARRKLLQFITPLVMAIYPQSNDTFAGRLWGRIMSYPFRLMDPSASLLNLDRISGPIIFHSTLCPLPEQLKKVKGVKRFITIYDLIPILFPKFSKDKDDKSPMRVLNSIQSEDWIIVSSKATQNDLYNVLKIDPSQAPVIYLAASSSFFPCHDSLLIQSTLQKYFIPENPYILSLSNQEPRKNTGHLIHCFAKLINEEKIKDLNLVLAGPKGWGTDPLTRVVSSYACLKDRVIFTGFIEDKDLSPLYTGALAFVYPSLYEGFGLPPLEAMQCGTPVITSNTSSLPEVVGDAGIMVDPKDEDLLCQKMLELYHDQSLRNKLASKAIDRAKLFSWKRCADETISAYKKALDS